MSLKGADRDAEPPWMAGFGALSDLSSENRLILAAMEEEFETLAPEDFADTAPARRTTVHRARGSKPRTSPRRRRTAE